MMIFIAWIVFILSEQKKKKQLNLIKKYVKIKIIIILGCSKDAKILIFNQHQNSS